MLHINFATNCYMLLSYELYFGFQLLRCVNLSFLVAGRSGSWSDGGYLADEDRSAALISELWSGSGRSSWVPRSSGLCATQDMIIMYFHMCVAGFTGHMPKWRWSDYEIWGVQYTTVPSCHGPCVASYAVNSRLFSLLASLGRPTYLSADLCFTTDSFFFFFFLVLFFAA